MSDQKAGVRYSRGTFQQTCGFCGCIFRVEVPGQAGRDGPENYSCPECRRKFPVKASAPPSITLISKRTDGLMKRCPADWEIPRPTKVRTPPQAGKPARGMLGARRGKKGAA